MNTAITAEKASEIIEAVIAKGDLEQLSAQERAKYYVRVCESIGLNPMTRPFEYLKLNGRLILYARKDATDQLRKIYGVSITDLTERERDGVFTDRRQGHRPGRPHRHGDRRRQHQSIARREPRQRFYESRDQGEASRHAFDLRPRLPR